MNGMEAKTPTTQPNLNNQPSPFELLLASGRAFEMTLPDGTHIKVPATTPATTPAPTQPCTPPADACTQSCTPPCTQSVYTADAPEMESMESEAAIPDSASDDTALAPPDDVHRDVHEMVSPQAVTVYSMFEEVQDSVLTGALVSQRLGISRAHACNLLTELYDAGLASKAGRGKYKYVQSLALPPPTPCTPNTRAACQPEYRDGNSIDRKFLPPIEKPLTTITFYEVDSKREIRDMSREEGIPPSPPSPSPSLRNTSTSPPRPATPDRVKPKRVYTRCQADYCSNRISAALRRQGSELCQDCIDADAASAADIEAETAYEYADSNDNDNDSPAVIDDDGEEDDDFGGTYGTYNRPAAIAPAPAPARTFFSPRPRPPYRRPPANRSHLVFDDD